MLNIILMVHKEDVLVLMVYVCQTGAPGGYSGKRDLKHTQQLHKSQTSRSVRKGIYETSGH